MVSGIRTTEIRLVGGLGNQLFGLAAGRFLQEIHGHEVTYNTWNIGRLGFNHGVTLTGRALNDRFVNRRPIFGLSHKRMMRVLPSLEKTYHSPELGWDANLAVAGRGTKVTGYFQSWRYPSAVYNKICAEDLRLLRGPSSWLLEELHQAREIRPVVVHLRRGDYQLVADSFGLVGADFLKRAVEKVRSSGIGNPIWVFSDEPEYARQLFIELKLAGRIIVPPPSSEPGESLALMSKGVANIISNSTFAWWGAFLNRSAKMTIAPQPWFRGIGEPQDLIPEHWLRVNHAFGKNLE